MLARLAVSWLVLELVKRRNFGRKGRSRLLSARPPVVEVTKLASLFGVARLSWAERGDFIAPVECEGYLLRLVVGEGWDMPAVVGVAKSSTGCGLFIARVEVEGYLLIAILETGDSAIGNGVDLMARVEFDGYRRKDSW